MKMKWISVLTFCLVVCAVRAIDKDVGNANDFIDKALENLRNDKEVSKYMDPLSVPDYYDSSYNLRNMKVKGLSKLYRHGDCTLFYDGETVRIMAEIGVKNVEIQTDYSAKAWFFWIHGSGLLDVKSVVIKLDVVSTNGKASVNSLKVTHLDNYSIRWITGLSFMLDWLLKIIANSVLQNARPQIIYALENEGAKALGDVIGQYVLPIY